MKILVIHGPNINMLGKREPEHYGAVTMQEINEKLERKASELSNDLELEFFQSNIEGEIVNKIQSCLENFDGHIL